MPMARALLVLALASSAALADEVVTLGGKTLLGTLESIRDGKVTLRTPAGQESQPLSRVLVVNLRAVKGTAAEDKHDELRLIDGTVLRCRKVEFQGDKVEAALSSGTKLTLGLSMVRTFLRDAHNEPIARKFAGLASASVRRDRIVILRGGELNALDGILSDVDAAAQTIRFSPDTGGAAVALPLSRLHGIVFLRTQIPTESPICKVFDTHGNYLLALDLEHDGAKLTLTTTFGAKITLPGAQLAKLDFNLGKLTYLSDMEPAKVVERSSIGLIHHYSKDASLDGEPIVLGGKPYDKGLSLHAYTELEFNLGGNYKFFKAVLGIDGRTIDSSKGAQSNPRLTIYCDGVKKHSTEENLNGKEPQPLALDVTGVTTLRIVVSSHNSLDLHDHLTLADARVTQ